MDGPGPLIAADAASPHRWAAPVVSRMSPKSGSLTPRSCASGRRSPDLVPTQHAAVDVTEPGSAAAPNTPKPRRIRVRLGWRVTSRVGFVRYHVALQHSSQLWSQSSWHLSIKLGTTTEFEQFLTVVGTREPGSATALQRRATVQVTWCYELSPSGGSGTKVTESFEWKDICAMRLYWRRSAGCAAGIAPECGLRRERPPSPATPASPTPATATTTPPPSPADQPAAHRSSVTIGRADRHSASNSLSTTPSKTQTRGQSHSRSERFR